VAPENQPAKLVYLEKIKEKYKNINELNKAWATSFDDWSGFLKNDRVIPEAAADMREFMKEFTSHYYATCRDAVKRLPLICYISDAGWISTCTLKIHHLIISSGSHQNIVMW